MIQTHGEIAPRVIYVPERDAYADEQRSNGVNQREISASLLIPIRGQPQSHDLHQETGPNYRDVFALDGSSSSHRQSRRCVPFTFSTFQPLLSIFNETSRFARYFERVDLSFLDAYNHPFSHELLPANCRLCPLPTAAALFMIREGTHSPPGDDQRRQGIGFHQSFILCPKGWRGRKRPFQFSRRSKVF